MLTQEQKKDLFKQSVYTLFAYSDFNPMYDDVDEETVEFLDSIWESNQVETIVETLWGIIRNKAEELFGEKSHEEIV